MFGLLTLWALWSWNSHYAHGQGTVLQFRVLHDAQGAWQASDALQRLTQAAPEPVQQQDGNLHETPFWLLLQPLDAPPRLHASSSPHATPTVWLVGMPAP
ncbi:MAG: hypothetical protein M1359_06210 [Betaproteobacteria bacterium]|nr:hypothetical protein [Betaproteobacteria bacterium]